MESHYFVLHMELIKFKSNFSFKSEENKTYSVK